MTRSEYLDGPSCRDVSNERMVLEIESRPWLEHPKQMWLRHKERVFENLTERFNAGKANIEIATPVHKNSSDLPFLLYSLGNLRVSDNKALSLTMVMHNADEESWQIAEELREAGVPVHIKRLDDPLLTGPYMSWQYLVACCEGDLLATVDADSAVTPGWIEKLYKPFVSSPALISGGPRYYFSKANFAIRGYKSLVNTHLMRKQNLGVKDFVAGNSTVKADPIKDIVHEQMLGMPAGDWMLHNIVRDTYGGDAIRFVNAPVLNNGDKFNNMTPPQFIGYAARSLARRTPLQKVYEASSASYYLTSPHGSTYHYNPWTRDIISVWAQTGSLSVEELYGSFEQTAIKQGFTDNPYVQRFLQDRPLGIGELTSPHHIFTALCQLARYTTRPTMEDHLDAEG